MSFIYRQRFMGKLACKNANMAKSKDNRIFFLFKFIEMYVIINLLYFLLFFTQSFKYFSVSPVNSWRFKHSWILLVTALHLKHTVRFCDT